MIPNAVMLRPHLSCGAKVMYGYLKHIAWRDGSAEQSRDEIREALGIGRDQVTAYIKELCAEPVGDDPAGPFLVDAHRPGLGKPNEYVIHDPETPGITESRRRESSLQEDANDAFPPSSQDLQPKTTPLVSPPAAAASITGAVDRKPVTLAEAELAQTVLDEWNGQTGQALRSRDWLAKIVSRAREHPEFTAVDHAHLIAANLAAPWWKGPATPSVVYGNGSQFERAILAANGDRSARASPPMRYGRGMTTRQILDATEGLE